MNFISLEPSLQQPNLNQKNVCCATMTVLDAFMIVSFLVLDVFFMVKSISTGINDNAYILVLGKPHRLQC